LQRAGIEFDSRNDLRFLKTWALVAKFLCDILQSTGANNCEIEPPQDLLRMSSGEAVQFSLGFLVWQGRGINPSSFLRRFVDRMHGPEKNENKPPPFNVRSNKRMYPIAIKQASL
jgi:hypothetical protein